MTRSTHTLRRKVRFINPRIQGGAALLFASVIAAGGAAFGVLAGKALRQMLLSAAVRGHFPMRSAFEIVREPLILHLAALCAGIFLAAAALFLGLAFLARRGIGRVIDGLRRSASRDLTSPTRVRGFPEAARLGGQVDDARAATHEAIRAIRAEAEDLAASGAPMDGFRLRWDALKQQIRGIAP